MFLMKELVTDFDIVFRCESSEKLDEFLVSYEGTEKSCLYVFDLSNEYVDNSIKLKNCRLKGKYKHVMSNVSNGSFEMFKNILDFDRNYDFFKNEYVVFCDGIQLFDDTLDVSASVINEKKCLLVSPVSVDQDGSLKHVGTFNPKCFIVNRSIASKILNNFKVKDYQTFIELAKVNNNKFVFSNAMVFE